MWEIKSVRITSMLDAISYLILMAYAMPMKYVWGDSAPVSVTGRAHGVFFVSLCVAILLALLRSKLSFLDCVKVGLAALVPIVPFLLDSWLKKKQS